MKPLTLGECDCCSMPNRVLHKCEVTGIETYACAECQYGSLSDDIADIEYEIQRIIKDVHSATLTDLALLDNLQMALLEARTLT